MAITKATTTEDLTASAKSAAPTEADTLAGIEEATAPEMLAKVEAPKYTRVKSPAGFVSDVPEGIVQSLLDSGYSKSK